MTTSALDRLFGSFVPLVVPFDDGAVDDEAYARLCDWQIKQDSSGLLVNAISGEPTTLALELIVDGYAAGKKTEGRNG